MVIYADILLLVNFAVDYFLLRLTAVILRAHPPLWRTLFASLAAAATSLYIFLPQSPAIIEIAVRTVFSLLITLIGFGFKGARRFFRTSAIFLLITFGYAGCMAALWYTLKPRGMAINNSVVYINISPVALILSSAAFYFAASAVKLFFGKKTARAERCTVTVFIGGKSVKLEGITDTGNGLSDPFTGKAVIVMNKDDLLPLLEGDSSPRFRTLPCTTVSGSALLNAYRTDKVVIEKTGKKTVIKNAIAAVSETPVAEHGVLLNPDIFLWE